MTANDSLVRTLLLVLVAIVLLPMLLMTIAMPMMGLWGGGHMWNGGMWNGTGAGWIGLLFWLVFLVVLVAVLYGLYGALRDAGGDGDRAREELRLAYARGELSDEEYETRRERLERDR